jgi:ABC-2 type transport system ATP-binding protein
VPPEAIVSMQGVTKRYGAFAALDGLDLAIQEGELYGLLGPNGAGKTTAIRILTGLQRATSGSVSVLGHPPQSRAVRPLVGYMPQETALYLDLTVRENLDLFGKLYGLGRDARRARIAELLGFIDLAPWGDAVVATLSGGMRHRASLAAALLPKPRLLVLDEPTVGVDPELRAGFWQAFDRMRAEGTTILITTHYMDEATRCARIGLLRAGRMLREGTPREIMDAAGASTLEDAFLRLAARHPEAAA